MKSKLWTIGKITGVLLILTILFTFLIKDYNRNVDESMEQREALRLDVAIVNEDRGIVANENEYNLGANYIKKIEKDTSQNWYVVSRGVAESGLKDGTYQLSIVIPSNFSQKILDINSTQPAPMQLDYKINANGNINVESQSKLVGERIIKDLNQQLIDMYVVSILDNLYTAQQNVRKVADIRTENVGDYEETIYSKADAFLDQYWPGLLQQSEVSKERNHSFTEGLQNFTNMEVTGLLESQNMFDESLASLMEQRSQGRLTYEDFQEKLLSMSHDMFNETQTIYNQLDLINENLPRDIRQLEEEFETMVADKVESMDAYAEGQSEKLKERRAGVEESVRQQIVRHFGKEDVTLKELLSASGRNQVGRAERTIGGIQVDVNSRFDEANDALEHLPYTLAQLEENRVQEILGDGLDEIKSKAHGIDTKIRRVNNTGNETLQLEFSGNENQRETLEDLYNTYKDVRVSETVTLTIQGIIPEEEETTPTATVRIGNVPEGVTIEEESFEDQEFNNGDKVEIPFTLEPGATGELEINVDGISTSEQMSWSMGEAAVDGTAWKLSIPVNRVLTSDDTYVEAKENWQKEVNRIKGLYQGSASYLNTFNDFDGSVYRNLDNLLEIDVTEAFTGILGTIYDGSYDEQKEIIDDLRQSARKIKTELAEEIADVKRENENILKDVKDHLNELSGIVDDWNNQMDTVSSGEADLANDNRMMDSEIQHKKTSMEILLEQSQALRESSEQNVEQSNSINEVFDDFDEQVRVAQEETEDLQSNANTLMTRFQEELETNDDFVSSFVGVLDNAYMDGVPNDQLIQFIANPIDGTSEVARAARTSNTSSTTHSFTWILFVYVMSFFMAHSFANHNFIKRKKDEFQVEASWMKDNLLIELILIGISVVVGGLIASISLANVTLAKEVQIGWILTIIGIMIVFTLFNHYLFKQFKLVGMAVSLFALVSYVFVSGATGNIGIYSGVSGWLRKINPLAFAEKILNGFLNNRMIEFDTIFTLIVLIVVGFLLNLFIRNKALGERKQIENEVTS